MVKKFTERTGRSQLKSVRDSRRTRKDMESTLKPQIESKSYKHTINKAQGYESKTIDPVLSLHGVVCATKSSIKTNTTDKDVQGHESKTNNSTPISTGTTESVKQTETSLPVVTRSSVTHTVMSTSSPSVTELIPIPLQPQMQSLTQPSLQPSQPLLQPESQPNLRTESQPNLRTESQPNLRPESKPSLQPQSQPFLQLQSQPSSQQNLQQQLPHKTSLAGANQSQKQENVTVCKLQSVSQFSLEIQLRDKTGEGYCRLHK